MCLCVDLVIMYLEIFDGIFGVTKEGISSTEKTIRFFAAAVAFVAVTYAILVAIGMFIAQIRSN